MSISANQLRPGNIIEHDGKLWLCLESVHKTPGNLRAFIQAKMRSIKDGVQKEFRFSSTEILEKVSLRERPMQFLCVDGDFFNFMDSENYEQVHLSKGLVGEAANYLLPDAQVKVTFFEESPIGIALPTTMDFTVIEAEPGMKTATASASYKNAKIETGVTIKVPQFVTTGERITINPATGEYLERAKSK